MSTWERITTVVLSALLGGGLLWGLGEAGVGALLRAWTTPAHSPALLQVALLTLAGAGWLRWLVLLGPLARSAAALHWDPDGSARIRPAERWVVVAGALTVAALLCLVVVVAPATSAPRVLEPGLGSGAVAVGTGALAVLAWVGQRRDVRPLLEASVRALALGALALFAAASGQDAIAGGIAVVGVVLLAVGSRADARRGRPGRRALPPRWSLVRAAEERWALRAGVALLDGSVTRETRERWGPAERRPRWGVRASTREGWRATLVRAAVIAWRQAPRLIGPAVAAVYVAPTVAATAPGGAAVAVVALATGWAVAASAAQSDRWAEAPALARTHADMGTAQILLAPSVAAGSVAVAGAVAVHLAAGLSPVHAALLLAVAAIGVRRRHGAHRPQVDEVWVTSPAGAVPFTTIDRIVAGADVAVVVALVVTL